MKPRFPRNAKRLLLIAVAVGSLPVALAFRLDGTRWNDGRTTLHVGMPGLSPSGISWSAALREAAQQWTDRTDFTFIADNAYLSPCAGYARSSGGPDFPTGGGDGRNGADFRRDVCGNSFGDNVLAITLTLSTRGNLGFDRITQSDVIFNDNLNWDVYAGARRANVHDFGRVALHELGHVLGLDHEPAALAIMQPTVSNIDSLQADDTAGANALYGIPTNCQIAELSTNAFVRDGLQQGDCRVMDLYGGGRDTSFVDVYQLRLAQATHLRIAMQSPQVDSVLILTDQNLNNLELEDDSPGSCDALMDVTVPAGNYLLLANTYDVPEKCVGNTGPYTISITDTAYPQMGQAANTAGGALADALFSGGASADGGVTFRQQFSSQELIDVAAQIAVDPAHVGRPGKVYVLAVLGNGAQFAKNSLGAFMAFSGPVSGLPALRSGSLAALEKITVINGLQGLASGLAGQSFSVYVGYALDERPQEIHFGNNPIRFTISP
jgi:hypothetical protein